jgi:hypothetical protein
MAENPTINQLVQIGIETTAGTGVAATKRFTAMKVEPGVRADVKTYKAAGYRFPTVASLSKEWVESALSGPLTYTEIIYALSSLIKAVTPSGAGTAKTWAFAPTSTGGDTRKTFTVEHGSSDRGKKFAYGLVTGLTFEFSREECTLSGAMLGKALQDNQALTALTSAAEIALLPVMPTQVALYVADTAAGLAGATAMTRAFSAGFTLENLTGPIYPLNQSSSFTAMVETEPTGTFRLKAAVDSEGMALLTNLRAGSTKFIRIKALGDLITGSDYYMLQVDAAIKVTKPQDFSDEQGVYAIGWDGELTHDSTWGKACEITVVNIAATL